MLCGEEEGGWPSHCPVFHQCNLVYEVTSALMMYLNEACCFEHWIDRNYLIPFVAEQDA